MAELAPLWQPSSDRVMASQMRDFMERMNRLHGVPTEWEALRRWSIERRDLFWAEMLTFADIHPSNAAATTFDGEGMLGTRWFPDMRLNYARHLLRHTGDGDAILFEGELGQTARYSWRELREEVARCAAALKSDGVRCGDRVAGFMPNVPEAIVAMLAAASLGAVWSSCSPDFGVRGVLDRFGQIEPTVLITADGYSYSGKKFELGERVAALAADLPSVRRVVVAEYCGSSGPARWTSWRDYLGPTDRPSPPLDIAEVPFDHPLFIMYSSGTTGIPKCIVHGHGGTLLQHMKELMLHCDLRPGERIFYFTTCGWMMWNWLVSGLGVGATVVLFDGSPAHPTPHRLWELAANLRVNVFGTSPKFLGACQKAHLSPGREHDLSALRSVLATGSPLSSELFHWVYDEVKHDVQLSSICGGTDIISCFMLGNPVLPVYAGEIQCRGLGMDVQAWDGPNNPVVGRKGELICAAPFPSQPVGFWNDPDGSKYRKAYFEHYAGSGISDRGSENTAASDPRSRIPDTYLSWRHGDYIEITPSGGVIVYGRSDATLNPGGVRIGTAEIYRVVESIPEITDSIVVGRRVEDDEEIALFVVLRPGLTLSKELMESIRQAIAAGATKRHVPKHIRQVSEIPCTISGKKVELAVQQMLHGEEVKNRDALANPQALEQFREIL